MPDPQDQVAPPFGGGISCRKEAQKAQRGKAATEGGDTV
jgi:hypothetical protein